MSIHRSARYDEIRDKVAADYFQPHDDPRIAEWDRKTAPKWRNRVGLRRLTAQEVTFEAFYLIKSIGGNLFQNDPEERALYQQAIDAVDDLAVQIRTSNLLAVLALAPAALDDVDVSKSSNEKYRARQTRLNGVRAQVRAGLGLEETDRD